MSVVGVLELLFLIIVIAILVVLFRNSKKALFGLGVIVCVGLYAFVMNKTINYCNSDCVTISSEVDLTKTVKMNVKNKSLDYRGYYHFICPYKEDKLINKIIRQFDIVVYDKRSQLYFLIKDNIMWSLEFVQKTDGVLNDKYEYKVRAESVNVTGTGVYENDIIISFPTSLISETVDMDKHIYNMDYNFDAIKDYYEYFNNTTIRDDEIIIAIKNKVVTIKKIDTYRIQICIKE